MYDSCEALKSKELQPLLPEAQDWLCIISWMLRGNKPHNPSFHKDEWFTCCVKCKSPPPPILQSPDRLTQAAMLWSLPLVSGPLCWVEVRCALWWYSNLLIYPSWPLCILLSLHSSLYLSLLLSLSLSLTHSLTQSLWLVLLIHYCQYPLFFIYLSFSFPLFCIVIGAHVVKQYYTVDLSKIWFQLPWSCVLSPCGDKGRSGEYPCGVNG